MVFTVPYVPQSVVSFLLFLVVGFLVGAAAKRAIVAVALLLLAGFIAAFAGLSILSFYTSAITQHVPAILATAYNHFGRALDTLPIAFLVGLALGFWKG